MSHWITIGSINAAVAVATGAFGAHGLKNTVKDTNLLQTWATASQYHLIHSVALCITPLIIPHTKQSIRAAQLFNIGIVLFSGSLYALVLTEQKKLGAITPLGGLAFIGGWIALALRK